MIDTSTFTQGLYVMVMGMAVVFAALALVMLAVMALDRLFRPKQEVAEEASEATTPTSAEEPAPATSEGQTSAEALVAAIAVALALRQQEKVVPPAPVRLISIQDEPSLWAAIGKLQ